MLIAIHKRDGGFWVRMRDDMPRVYCPSRDAAIRLLEQNAFGIVRLSFRQF
jgi:hypothetical protein